MLTTALAVGAAAAAPGKHPALWPSAFTCDFSVRKSDAFGDVLNEGKYWYNWTDSARMLITNRNCTGGSPARRDLHCSALHRDGQLYGYGASPQPWLCLWHSNFTATPPDWIINATLVDANSSLGGVPAARYELIKPVVYPTHHYYQRLDNSLPLGFVNGFGSTFFWENVDTTTPIPEKTFDFPAQKAGSCPWDSAVWTPHMPAPADSADLVRAKQRVPGAHVRGSGFRGIARKLNDHLRGTESLRLRDCGSFSPSDLTALRSTLRSRMSPELNAIYAAAADTRALSHADVSDEAAERATGVAAELLHDARCFETVMWWVHHLSHTERAMSTELPLLPEAKRAAPGGGSAEQEAHDAYVGATTCSACHSMSG
eukprot:TRINITY_DN35384_c0_g1_i1.p1 TRINITY_DN35384_c0_g1~~TRINITY_DN35384_c0_g1_i1.p1  ORF type:complete len:390 (+),score=138.51 TRINITY_DN35384_c0_g1_i1:57-1172(+)